MRLLYLTLAVILCAFQLPAQSPAPRWTGGSSFLARSLQTVDGKMIVQRYPDGLVVMVYVPKDFIVADGTNLQIRIDKRTVRTVQYTDSLGALRTIIAVQSSGPPKVYDREFP